MHISDKDKALVESLVGVGDAQPQQRHFEHDFEVNQKILGMLIADRHFLTQSMDLIVPDYFEDQGHQLICSIVFDFFKRYKELPNKVYIAQEIKERRKNSDQLYTYLGELEAVIADYVPGVGTREYLMDKIVEFAKEQAVRIAVSRTLDIVKKKPDGVWNKVWDLWRDALTTDKSHDLGLEYYSTLEERYQRMEESMNSKSEIFTSGFETIDKWLTAKGLARGEIGAFIGTSGAGKSIALINAAVRNLSLGKRVCYITLEMSQDKIAKRFDALLSGEPFGTLFDNKNMVIEAIRQSIDMSLLPNETDKRRLIIKHYPGGTADVNTFRAYLSQLSLYGFKPDLLVVDYVGEMRDIPGLKTYESRQLLVRELRTLAQEEQMCVLTAMQANRKGREAQEVEGHIDDDALADAFGQARPMDAMWSLNKPESACNVGSIFVIKHRDGISRNEIYYRMDTGTLRMDETTQDEFRQTIKTYRSQKANQADAKIPKLGEQ